MRWRDEKGLGEGLERKGVKHSHQALEHRTAAWRLNTYILCLVASYAYLAMHMYLPILISLR